MKKSVYLILAMLFSSVTTFSQLKVNYDGSVRMTGSTSNFSRVYVGDSLSDSYSYKYGLHSALTSPTVSNGVGIKGLAKPNNTNTIYTAMGVWGDAGNAPYGNFGILGTMSGTGNGAGVYGTTGNTPNITISGRYAGYFSGDSYFIGDITASSYLTFSDTRLKDNIVSLKNEDNTLSNVMNMNTIKYNYKSGIDDGGSGNPLQGINNQQWHYGLSAQELQTIYPELVKEGQDGYLTVNYVELVPILIRSIQELKEELDMVKGEQGNMYKTRSAEKHNDNVISTESNVLYQNTPNPFKENTTIRFQLADDAQNAAICIFDMAGKMLKKLPVSQGMESVSIAGYELGEGMFLYTLMVNGQEIDTKRMIITK